MTTFLPPDSDTEDANCLILFRRVSILPCSEPLIIIQSRSSSLHKAFATVVLPRPAVPVNNMLGSYPNQQCVEKSFLNFRVEYILIFFWDDTFRTKGNHV